VDEAHRVEVDDRGGAVLAYGFAEVEAVQPSPLPVVGEPIRVRAHLDLPEQLLIRAAKGTDARTDARGAPITREEQVVLFVDQHTGHTRELRERAQEGARANVEYVDAVGAGVRDVHPPGRPVNARVVEAGFGARRDRHEPDLVESHAAAGACSTSCLHQA
jgi:hypothetical protein